MVFDPNEIWHCYKLQESVVHQMNFTEMGLKQLYLEFCG